MTEQPSTSKTTTENEAQDLEDEIPAYTKTSITATKIRELNIEKYAAKRVIKLFISHLLDTEMVKNHDKIEKHFFIKDITFRNILIRGIIVGIEFPMFKVKHRTVLSVDDGTGVLDCYVEENKFLEDTRSDVYMQLENTIEMFEADKADIVLKAALTMLQTSKDRLKKLPHYRSFKLGETVELIGTLSEYKGRRSCFVSSIIKDGGVGNTCYLEEVFNLYESTYFNNEP